MRRAGIITGSMVALMPPVVVCIPHHLSLHQELKTPLTVTGSGSTCSLRRRNINQAFNKIIVSNC
jgi:hypothetical protein